MLYEKDTDHVLFWDTRNMSQAEWLRHFASMAVSFLIRLPYPRKVIEKVGLQQQVRAGAGL